MRMKTRIVIALLAAIFSLTSEAADLTAADKQFLAQYEKVRAGLAGDKLADAQAAAAEMGEEGASIAATDSIIIARKEFATLSEHAIKLAGGQSGYYVAHCPMLKKDWVQTSTKISNPYAGISMLTCGSIKK
jgi:hypothetical protein